MRIIFKGYFGWFVLIPVAILMLTGVVLLFDAAGVPEVIVSGVVLFGVLIFFGRRIYMKYNEK